MRGGQVATPQDLRAMREELNERRLSSGADEQVAVENPEGRGTGRLRPEPAPGIDPEQFRVGDEGERFDPEAMVAQHNDTVGAEPESLRVRIGGGRAAERRAAEERAEGTRPGPSEVPPAPATGLVQKQAREYVAQRGDGLWRIAQKFYGVKNINEQMRAIQALNPGLALAEGHAGKTLRPGMTVMLPEDGLRGDTGSPAGASSQNSIDAAIKSSAGATEHIIAEGDSLWKISERYYGAGKHWKRLAKHNRIDPDDKLLAGKKIRIPATLD